MRDFQATWTSLCYNFDVTKEDIRRRVLALRESQSQEEKKRKDKAIFDRLLSVPAFAQAREFFTYLSHKGEVSTDLLLAKFLGKKIVVVPKIESEAICLYELTSTDEWRSGPYNIREPVHCLSKSQWDSIDVAIIPGVAFDETGHRIGFGGGYFDRFLKKLHCTTIGFAYELQMIDKVPVHSYDVPVDFIVTEKRLLSF